MIAGDWGIYLCASWLAVLSILPGILAAWGWGAAAVRGVIGAKSGFCAGWRTMGGLISDFEEFFASGSKIFILAYHSMRFRHCPDIS